MASRPFTASTDAPFPHRAALVAVPQLDDVRAAIYAESNVARLLHRMSMDMRENLPDGTDLDIRADIDALCSELGRLEARLGALAESLDVAGGAEISPLDRHLKVLT